MTFFPAFLPERACLRSTIFSAGPVTCAACHWVNKKGVPVQLRATDYFNDYWASVVFIHFIREGDRGMPLPELLKKYPYRKARKIVAKGWR